MKDKATDKQLKWLAQNHDVLLALSRATVYHVSKVQGKSTVDNLYKNQKEFKPKLRK